MRVCKHVYIIHIDLLEWGGYAGVYYSFIPSYLPKVHLYPENTY